MTTALTHALLDSYVASGTTNGSLFLHETAATSYLPSAVAEWARLRALRIEVTPNMRDGHAYECWDITVDGGSRIHFFPREIGLLDEPRRKELQAQVKRIEREAAEQIKALMAAVQS